MSQKNSSVKNNRARFLKTVANIPLNLRKDIILVFKNQPVTWNVIWIEVNSKTKIGDEMLEKLIELKFI